jgi:TetR/AcrR family transcriptional repressor of nem operon
MRYSNEHKERTRQLIVKKAAQHLRIRGLNGIGVATLMRTAGLTHGGFYAYFKSKIALVVEAIDVALEETCGLLQRAVAGAETGQGRRAIVETYLSAAHRDQPGKGCAIAALGADIARIPSKQRTRIDSRVEQLLALMNEQNITNRPDAIQQLATMVGGLILARVVADKDFSNEILDTLKAQYGDG